MKPEADAGRRGRTNFPAFPDTDSGVNLEISLSNFVNGSSSLRFFFKKSGGNKPGVSDEAAAYDNSWSEGFL